MKSYVLSRLFHLEPLRRNMYVTERITSSQRPFFLFSLVENQVRVLHFALLHVPTKIVVCFFLSL